MNVTYIKIKILPFHPTPDTVGPKLNLVYFEVVESNIVVQSLTASIPS